MRFTSTPPGRRLCARASLSKNTRTAKNAKAWSTISSPNAAARRNVTKYVLDSSALLAVVYEEHGAEQIEAIFSRSVLSAVNLADSIARIAQKGFPADEALLTLTDMVPTIVP